MRKREVQLRLFDQHFLTIIFSNFQFLKAIFVSVISTAIFPLKQQITFDARTRGDLATEFFPLPQNEFRKKKRTIYRKASHEFQHLLVAGKKYVVFRSPIIGFSVQLFTPIFRQNFSNHHRKCPEQKCFPICQNCQPLTV